MNKTRLATIAAIALSTALTATPQSTAAHAQQPLPRTSDGKPDLQGIWQASSSAGADLQDHAAALNMLAGRSVVAGATIPYQPWAAAKKAENFKNRQTADPLSKCYLPGVPRIMYLDFPFQIFQNQKSVTLAFEWELDYRLIYTDGTPHRPADDDSWMGDSRGHWEGSTLVVDVADNNDKAVFDMAGHFHSDQLHIVERFTPVDKDTINYEATFDDPRVFTRPFQMKFQLKRSTSAYEFFESDCFGGERDQEHIKEGLADLKDHYYK